MFISLPSQVSYAMNPQQILDFFGNANKAAKAIGVARQTVGAWKKTDYVPFAMQEKIELLTDGELKADGICVTVNDLLEFFGSINLAARALMIHPRVIRGWRQRNTIPFYLHRMILSRIKTWKHQ